MTDYPYVVAKRRWRLVSNKDMHCEARNDFRRDRATSGAAGGGGVASFGIVLLSRDGEAVATYPGENRSLVIGQPVLASIDS